MIVRDVSIPRQLPENISIFPLSVSSGFVFCTHPLTNVSDLGQSACSIYHLTLNMEHFILPNTISGRFFIHRRDEGDYLCSRVS